MAYIEDDHMRFTILSGQPSGVACLKSGNYFQNNSLVFSSYQFILGVVDVFLDRRLLRDDNRGLGQGVTDNRELISSFKLLFEPRHTVRHHNL